MTYEELLAEVESLNTEQPLIDNPFCINQYGDRLYLERKDDKDDDPFAIIESGQYLIMFTKRFHNLYHNYRGKLFIALTEYAKTPLRDR